jgi:hypothetical protein
LGVGKQQGLGNEFCQTIGDALSASNFFKGFMSTAQTAIMGYMWRIGGGSKIYLCKNN